jgi:endonuclease/exonuclease/phosphatase family metal-dependent hydrolase
MIEYLKKSKADVLCLQEFSNNIGPAFRSNYEDLSKIGYIYSYRTDEIKRVINGESVVGGTAIFSRIPIIDSGKVLLGDPSFPEHIAFVDVILQNKHLRIFTTHFKSLNLFALNRDPAAMVPFHYDTHFVYEASPFEKLKVFAQDHAKQSFVVKRELNKSPYPLIYAADMNSVPSSFPYHTVAKDLQDIFIKKGHGLGTTIDSLPKTLRIDFMLADKRIVIKSFWKDEVHLSDHFPQVADIAWKD